MAINIPPNSIFSEADAYLLAKIHKKLQATDNLRRHFYPDTTHEYNGITYHSRDKYEKHLDFFAASKTYKQRLVIAANRVGKTSAAAYEIVCHLSGRYPDWWTGAKFEHANNWWVCGETQREILNPLQPLFVGQVGKFGTGMVPYDLLDHDTLKQARKMETGIGSFRVKHIDGNWSTVTFKSYEQGRTAFQSAAVNIWADEEIPEEIYGECSMRTANIEHGMIIMTFTPLKGFSPLLNTYLKNKVDAKTEDLGNSKYVTRWSWEDCPHLTEEWKAQQYESLPPHQREARSRGIPTLGTGVIYPIVWDEVAIDPFTIPDDWPRVIGMDVGRHTAACWLAIDPSTTNIYLYDCYQVDNAEPHVHAANISAKGLSLSCKGENIKIPLAIDPASAGSSQIDGRQLMQMYRDLGLKVVPANNAVMAGISECWMLLSQGRLKIFSNIDPRFVNAYRNYIYDKNGNVRKVDDHLLDSFRYAIMTRNIAKSLLTLIAENNPEPEIYDTSYSNNPDAWMLN